RVGRATRETAATCRVARCEDDVVPPGATTRTVLSRACSLASIERSSLRYALVVLVALASAVPAAASSSEQWWTTDHAEGVLMDSDWSFDHDVQDATCAGWG